MSKQILNSNGKQMQEEIQFLLTTIRARQNGLIFFLERFSIQHYSPEQYRIYKGEFLEKEKIYSNQVLRIISKYTHASGLNFEKNIRTFWLKLKSIVKVSLDRLRILHLLNEKIFERYQDIINLVNYNYDHVKGLNQFADVENLLKKRNVDALMFSRQNTNHNSENKMSKNHSDSGFKQLKYSPPALKNKRGELSPLKISQDEQEKPIVPPRLKSLNRYKAKKLILYDKAAQLKGSEKHYKKFNKFVDKMKKNLDGAMDFVLDVNYDKKKTQYENSDSLYQSMFRKNIPQHKTVAKFLFNIYGTKDLIEQRIKRLKKINIKIQKVAKQKEKQSMTQANKIVKVKKNQERPQSSHTKTKNQKEQMVQTMMVDRKGKSKRRTIYPNKLAKFIKVF